MTLTGGGTVTLSSTAANGGYAYLTQYNGGTTLTNTNNTIQGEGIIYNNGTTVINEAGGTILANSTGAPLINTLTIQYGTVTNNGTLQANSGNTLWLYDGALTNFSGNTLTGGTYNVYGTAGSPGTLQIDALGNTGGEIQNNAATILLSGPNSSFLDAAGLDALSNFSNNTAAGSFTIQNGRNFQSPGDFANAGTVNIGAGSTFTTGPGAANDFNQSAGMTQVDGTLATSNANINGGLLMGVGAVNGNVNVAAGGTIKAGDAPGILTINGNLSLGGTMLVDIEGTTAGAGGYGQLVVNGGKASLGGTLDVDLLNGFSPTPGRIFTC